MIEGRKLQAFRKRHGLTQTQVAAELGVTKAAVADTEQRTVGTGTAERYLNAVAAAQAHMVGPLCVPSVRYFFRLEGERLGEPLLPEEMAELREILS